LRGICASGIGSRGRTRIRKRNVDFAILGQRRERWHGHPMLFHLGLNFTEALTDLGDARKRIGKILRAPRALKLETRDFELVNVPLGRARATRTNLPNRFDFWAASSWPCHDATPLVSGTSTEALKSALRFLVTRVPRACSATSSSMTRVASAWFSRTTFAEGPARTS
jgi:hypothetical protein